MRKNNGCLIFILIILALAGVAWVKYYVLPIIVIFIIIGVVNGKKNKEARNGDRAAGHENDGTGEGAYQDKNTEQGEYRNFANTRTDHTDRKASDTIITCDYCGSQIDTSQHTTCPHCGGPYWDNVQWKEIWKKKMS